MEARLPYPNEVGYVEFKALDDVEAHRRLKSKEKKLKALGV